MIDRFLNSKIIQLNESGITSHLWQQLLVMCLLARINTCLI